MWGVFKVSRSERQEERPSSAFVRMQVLAELMKPAQAAVDALARGASPEAAEAAAGAAEEAALTSAVPPKLDEFGRDENAYRRSRAQARAKRRAALIATLHGRARGNAATALLDGAALSAAAAAAAPGDAADDDSSTPYYTRRVRELEEVAGAVFDDVAPEFASLGAVLERLKKFKREHGAQYRTAFLSEALPALSSVFVRLQVLRWDPLYGGGVPEAERPAAVKAFEEQDWFSELFEFSGAGVCCSAGEPDHS
jgi:GC-rich sequence DNA-binding factor